MFAKSYLIKKVFLIEPQKEYFYYLKDKYKDLKNIQIFDCALSNKNGISFFYINHHDLTSSLNILNQKNNFLKFKSILFGVKSGEMIRKKTKIKIKTLNNLIKKYKIKQFDLVKIDTEGHEYEVLQGATVLKN